MQVTVYCRNAETTHKDTCDTVMDLHQWQHQMNITGITTA